MITKGITYEDFVNYKKPSMFIAFPYCTFKCETESGVACCQNSGLAKAPEIEIDLSEIVHDYIHNPITKAVVCGGLEPFMTWVALFGLVRYLRECDCEDDIVIYTGYTEKEIAPYIDILKQYDNIIVKFGRYIPGDTEHYDEVLGVNLASSNQYAKRIS